MAAGRLPRLGTTAFGNAALSILCAGIDAADAGRAIEAAVRLAGDVIKIGDQLWPLPPGDLLLCGAGKASGFMAAALERLLGSRIDGGLVIVPHSAPPLALRHVAVARGAHPVPDRAGLEATRRLCAELAPLTAVDGVVVVISGGASALLEWPLSGVTLADLAELNTRLLRSGTAIREVNGVRTAVSRVKGGGLAAIAAPARVLTLIVSDVPGDDVNVIGSGPTAAPCASATEVLDLVERRRVAGELSEHVVAALRSAARRAREAPVAAANVTHAVVASNATAIAACGRRAAELGYSLAEPLRVQGEARRAADHLLAKYAGAGSGCLLAGGETTVTVHGDGIGGRNQEMALAMALLLDGRSDVCFASLGSDGIDGPTEAAGALVDGSTAGRMRSVGVDPVRALHDNDSHAALAASGDLVITGPTRTNVMDLQVLLSTEVA